MEIDGRIQIGSGFMELASPQPRGSGNEVRVG
jgi:hypothetical protein